MAKIDKIIHEMYASVINNGEVYLDPNRKGVKRVEIPKYSFYYDMENGFPIITTKKIQWNSIVAETLWFLRGGTNIKFLLDNKCSIWNEDTYNYYVKKCKEVGVIPVDIKTFVQDVKGGKKACEKLESIDYELGDCGKIYGYQLRTFNGWYDQLSMIIKEMINNPLSTKKDVTYVNPTDKNNQALTPCHTGWSIVMRKDLSGFELSFKLSSADLFLGTPFNIGSYALIGAILEAVTKRRFLGLHYTAENAHIYEPHLTAVEKQLKNSANKYEACSLRVKPEVRDNLMIQGVDAIESLKVGDFTLEDYNSYGSIGAKMLAYS